MVAMRNPFRTITLAAAAILLLTGCSYSYPFQLLLTVKDAETGKPLEGVTGVLDTTDREEAKYQMESGFSLRRETGAGGGLMHDFQITNKPDQYRHWFLKLRKEGYEPTVVDIRPDPVPETKERISIPIAVKMKPLVPPAPAP